MEKGNYNIGLDIGTNSVGWAVIDDNYNLLKKKKKNLFGVYLFEQGQTAADRRTKRSMRRRLERRRQRLALVRELFSAELQKVDPSFLLRLSQSKLNKKDVNKEHPGYILFNDDNYTDKNFYDEYPTIFHLQKEMLEHPEKKQDIRKLFLVASHIAKYRGNFTDEAQSLNDGEESFAELLGAFNEEFERQGYGLLLNDSLFSSIENIAQDEAQTASDRQKALVQLITANNADKSYKTQVTEFVKLVLGLKGDFTKLFQLDDDSDSNSLKLSDRNVETQLETVTQSLTSEQNIILEQIQQLYSKIVLHKILKDEKFLSIARVKSYDKHKADLSALKSMWSNDLSDHEKEVKEAKKAYDDYVNHGLFAEDFYKKLSAYLKVASDKEAVAEIEKDIEMNSYLPKQRTNQNGAIPYQIYHRELKSILEAQSKFYPFLEEKDSEGISVTEKLLKIHSFRIPYYVGPLNQNSSFSWMVRKSEGKIYPWNFDEKVDRDKSSIKFIEKMTGTDTYLLGEPVVPKYSLLYQKYEVLNELNKIRINGEPLDTPLKQSIFNDVFKKHRTVTVKLLQTYLIREQGYSSKNKPEIDGLSRITEFSSNLSTYLDLVKVFGQDFVESKNNQEFLEEIVTWLTVFEDKKILNRRLADIKDKVDSRQAKQLLQYRYTGWGRLSKKLLSDLKVTYKPKFAHQEQKYSIIDLLWDTNLNLMQIVNDKEIGFAELLKEENGDSNNSTWEAIDMLGGSPAIKKGIRQAVRVVDDIVKAMKSTPKRVYLEFAREDQASQRTNSRYKQLKDKYAAIKKMSDSELPGLMSNIKSDKSLAKMLDDNKSVLSSERFFLYFLQGGKSLYSGEPIDINLLNSTVYEVDHIIPRSYIKDDSIENKALVLKDENQNKTNKLLLSPDTIRSMYPIWLAMKKAGLMTDKKFNNLIRTSFSENQLKGFVNRQLVETRQIIKNTAIILDERYREFGTKSVPVKADLSMRFRSEFDLPKSRNVNDYHHAHDAYLAAFLGTYIARKYPNFSDSQVYDAYNKYIEETNKELKKTGKLNVLRKDYILQQLNHVQADNVNGEKIWDPSKLEYIKQVFEYKQMNIVKKTEIRDGALFKETVFAPGAKNNLIPLKKGQNPDLYGGYSSQQFAYSVLCDIDGKKTLVGLPIAVMHRIEGPNKNELLENWIDENVSYKKSIEIILPRVPIYQKVWSEEKGNIILASPKEIQNGQQLVLRNDIYIELAHLEKVPIVKLDSVVKENEINLNQVYLELIEIFGKKYPFYKSEFLKLSDASTINAFNAMKTTDKFSIIEEILKLTHQNALTSNLNFGKIKTTALGRKPNSAELSNTYFIYQSPTGLFEHRKYIE